MDPLIHIDSLHIEVTVETNVDVEVTTDLNAKPTIQPLTIGLVALAIAAAAYLYWTQVCSLS